MLYPNKVLNAGSNYYDHALEMGAAAPDHDKHEPYFFYKGSRHTLIGHGDTIVLTPRAKYIDWEAESRGCDRARSQERAGRSRARLHRGLYLL